MANGTVAIRVWALAQLPLVVWLAGYWLPPNDLPTTPALALRALQALVLIHISVVGLMVPAVRGEEHWTTCRQLALVPLPFYLVVAMLHGPLAAWSLAAWLIVAAWTMVLGRLAGTLSMQDKQGPSCDGTHSLPLLQFAAIVVPCLLLWQCSA